MPTDLTPSYPIIPSKEKIQIPEALSEQMGDVVGQWRRPQLESFKIEDTNTSVGQSAGISLTTGHSNTFIGNLTGQVDTTGYSNTFIGWGNGFSTTTGYQNTFLGNSAGKETVDGYENVFLGI